MKTWSIRPEDIDAIVILTSIVSFSHTRCSHRLRIMYVVQKTSMQTPSSAREHDATFYQHRAQRKTEGGIQQKSKRSRRINEPERD
jgi:hypothetical protein